VIWGFKQAACTACLCVLLSMPCNAADVPVKKGNSSAFKNRLVQSSIEKQTIPDKWFGSDKAKHFLASMVITGSSMWAAKHRWGSSAGQSRFFGITVGVSAGIIKEVMDKKGRGHFSWRDLAADAAGVLAGSVILAW